MGEDRLYEIAEADTKWREKNRENFREKFLKYPDEAGVQDHVYTVLESANRYQADQDPDKVKAFEDKRNLAIGFGFNLQRPVEEST